jgi:hypothetical protein
MAKFLVEEFSPDATRAAATHKNADEFVNYIRFLATSPQLEHSPAVPAILQFLNQPRTKTEHLSAVYYSIRDMNLPVSFWSALVPKIRQELAPSNELADAMVIALCAAPVNIILNEFMNFDFLRMLLPPIDRAQGGELLARRYAAFYAIYSFRNQIKFNDEIVTAALLELSSNRPGPIFICLNLLMFLITVDYPNIDKLIQPYKNTLLNVAFVHGHMLNMNHLSFIVKQAAHSIQTVFSLLPHLSVSASIFVLSLLPSIPDFPRVADLPPAAIVPQICDLITHSYSESCQGELFTTALQISRLTNSHHFFDELSQLLLRKDRQPMAVVALFADVAYSFQVLQRVLSKAIDAAVSKDLFCDLVAVAACIAADAGIDVTQTLLKLLSTQGEASPTWQLAAACVVLYICFQSQFMGDHIQSAFDVTQSMKSLPMRSIFLIALTDLVPVHLRPPLVDLMRQTLFVKRNEANKTTFTTDSADTVDIPLILKVGLAQSIAQISTQEQMRDLADEFNNPLYAVVVKQKARAKSEIPASPFVTCELSSLAVLASALTFRERAGKDVLGVSRPFVEISPAWHAMTVEMASLVSPKNRSVCLDLRLSGKGVIPSLVVSVQVPETLTPPQVPEWAIADLTEGTKVTHRLCFTVRSAENPFAQILIRHEKADVLDIKVCLPLIDLFVRTTQDEPSKAKETLTSEIWLKLRHQQEERVELDDAVWVAREGCVAVRNHVARSSKKAFLALLASANETRAVLD